ncbi:MAG: hypothetical protein Q7J30_00390 [Candidatus Azambacteria bacterium]|nr:hypothetical protein [Candidatus Azambacteria bacterium]
MKEETNVRIWRVVGVLVLIAVFSVISGVVSYDYGREDGIKYERGISLLEPVNGHMYKIIISASPITSGQKNGYYKVSDRESPENLSYDLQRALSESTIVGKIVIYNDGFKEAKIN